MARLSHRLKKQYDPIILKRDGSKCFYCKREFTETIPPEHDHLNNKPNDSRPENLVFCCHVCNNKKKTNPDMQVLAQEKMIQNEKAVFACAGTAGTAIDKKAEFVMGGGVKPTFQLLPDTGTTQQLTSQQEISKINMQITKQFLQEHTINGEKPILKDVVNAIVNLCQDNNGTGSQSAVYRYVDVLANPYNGRYTLSKNSQGKTIIRRRTEN